MRQSIQRCTGLDSGVLSQCRSAEIGWVRSAKCIIRAPVVPEELPFRKEQHGVGGWNGMRNGIEEQQSRYEDEGAPKAEDLIGQLY